MSSKFPYHPLHIYNTFDWTSFYEPVVLLVMLRFIVVMHPSVDKINLCPIFHSRNLKHFKTCDHCRETVWRFSRVGFLSEQPNVLKNCRAFFNIVNNIILDVKWKYIKILSCSTSRSCLTFRLSRDNSLNQRNLIEIGRASCRERV